MGLKFADIGADDFLRRLRALRCSTDTAHPEVIWLSGLLGDPGYLRSILVPMLRPIHLLVIRRFVGALEHDVILITIVEVIPRLGTEIMIVRTQASHGMKNILSYPGDSAI